MSACCRVGVFVVIVCLCNLVSVASLWACGPLWSFLCCCFVLKAPRLSGSPGLCLEDHKSLNYSETLFPATFTACSVNHLYCLWCHSKLQRLSLIFSTRLCYLYSISALSHDAGTCRCCTSCAVGTQFFLVRNTDCGSTLCNEVLVRECLKLCLSFSFIVFIYCFIIQWLY